MVNIPSPAELALMRKRLEATPSSSCTEAFQLPAAVKAIQALQARVAELEKFAKLYQVPPITSATNDPPGGNPHEGVTAINLGPSDVKPRKVKLRRVLTEAEVAQMPRPFGAWDEDVLAYPKEVSDG